MRDRKPVELGEKARTRAIASIQRYFLENMDEKIGELKAALVLDYILTEHGPAIYNQAMEDARSFMEERVLDLGALGYQHEFPYWQEKKKRSG